MFKIRKATIEDAFILADILSSSWSAAYKDIIPSHAIKARNERRFDMFKKTLMEEHSNYLAFDHEIAVGLFRISECLDKDIKGAGEVVAIYVHPNYFRRGYGTKIMNYACQLLKDLSYSKVILWALEDNYNAKKFYEKQGFIMDGAKKEMNIGKPLIAIRFIKEL